MSNRKKGNQEPRKDKLADRSKLSAISSKQTKGSGRACSPCATRGGGVARAVRDMCRAVLSKIQNTLIVTNIGYSRKNRTIE
eukprot:2519925-Pleurochrysis_carterae.AAC.1